MTTQRSFLKATAACLLGLAAVAAAPLARADNVYWSAGIAAAPGVVVNAGNVPPVAYVAPAPAYSYYYPQPVYTPPRVVYTAPAYAAPVYYAPAPVYMPPGYWHHRHHGHHGGGHFRH